MWEIFISELLNNFFLSEFNKQWNNYKYLEIGSMLTITGKKKKKRPHLYCLSLTGNVFELWKEGFITQWEKHWTRNLNLVFLIN